MRSIEGCCSRVVNFFKQLSIITKPKETFIGLNFSRFRYAVMISVVRTTRSDTSIPSRKSYFATDLSYVINKNHFIVSFL